MKNVICSRSVLILILHLASIFLYEKSFGQLNGISSCKVVWKTQSKNSSQSMPCGGGDIGLNVWVENGDLLFYMAESGTFDENNAMLKPGRIRIKISPNPFADSSFEQILNIHDGNIVITSKDIKIIIWVDVFRPVIHADIKSKKPVIIQALYENWRYKDHVISDAGELRSNSYKSKQAADVITYKDSVSFKNNSVIFFHRNRNNIKNIFDFTVEKEGLNSVKSEMFNPIINNSFGGMLIADGMQSFKIDSGKYADTYYKSYALQSKHTVHHQSINVVLNTEQTNTLQGWLDDLALLYQSALKTKNSSSSTVNWWHNYWKKSYIFIEGTDSVMSINYQLFRYMLGCNAYAKYPTKFNGGLFTFDPVYVDSSYRFSPDFRLWGGGTFTAQNQRLVYYGMLKSGDFDMMKSQFDFYTRIQKNAELRSKVYWNHDGACFTEQIENFGLPNVFEYGYERPENFDKGIEYNPWLEYTWETVFEFCNMMLETWLYTHADISSDIPFIESCLDFYDQHYRLLAQQRGYKIFDSSDHYVLYPTSAAETYKMAYNSTTVIAALQTVLQKLINLPTSYIDSTSIRKYSVMLKHIPPVPLTEINGNTTIAPAQTWQRINNSESPQLYPVFPWGIFGIGKPNIKTAVNTYQYDPEVINNKSPVGWRQENIFAARLGLDTEAYKLTQEKFIAGKHRFPAFFGPGYDWTPDMNHGGTAMIGLQEMLLQEVDDKIYLFPAWPKNKNVSFKLYAYDNTTVEASLNNGKVKSLKVIPEERKKDVIIMLK